MYCTNCQKEVPAGSNFCCSCGARQPNAAPFDAAAQQQYAPYGGARKRIVRSINDRKVGGVCAGVADYFDLDPMLVRIVWILLFLCGGTGGLAYLICWIVFPEGYTGLAHTSTPGYPAT